MSCPALSLSNGTVNYDRDRANNGQYPVNTTATFTCDDDYYPDGDESTTCESSGIWSQSIPTCMSNDIKINVYIFVQLKKCSRSQIRK